MSQNGPVEELLFKVIRVLLKKMFDQSYEDSVFPRKKIWYKN